MTVVESDGETMPNDAENPTEDAQSTGTDHVGTTHKQSDATQRALALCGIVAPTLIGVVTLVLADLTPNYSHVENTLSELGAVGAPYALYFNATFVVAGILVVAFAVGLHHGIGDGHGSVIGPGLVAVFGLFATAGIGLTPLESDPMAPVNLAHTVFVVVGFLGLTAGMYALSVRMADDPTWSGYALVTRWGSVVLLVLFSGWFLALVLVPLEPGEAPNGALQRPFVVWALLWTALTAITLFRLSE